MAEAARAADDGARAAGPGRPWRRSGPRAAAVEIALLAAGCTAAAVLGALTSPAQAVPALANGLANTPSGWTIPTVLIVLACARRPWTAALLGALSFAFLNLGYAVESTARGHPDSFAGVWVVAGFLVGPVVGLATFVLARRRGLLAAAGGAVLASIGLGDGAEALLRGGSVYGAVVAVLGLLCLAWAFRRSGAARARAVAVAAAAVLTGLYVAAFAALG